MGAEQEIILSVLLYQMPEKVKSFVTVTFLLLEPDKIQ